MLQTLRNKMHQINTYANLAGLLLETTSLSGLKCFQNVQIKVQTDDRYSFLNTFSHMYREEKNILWRDWEQLQIQEQFYQIFRLAALVSITQSTISFALSSKQSSVKEHNSVLFWSLCTASNPDNFSSSDATGEGEWSLGHAIFNACLPAMSSLSCHFDRGRQLCNSFTGEDMKAILEKLN